MESATVVYPTIGLVQAPTQLNCRSHSFHCSLAPPAHSLQWQRGGKSLAWFHTALTSQAEKSDPNPAHHDFVRVDRVQLAKSPSSDRQLLHDTNPPPGELESITMSAAQLLNPKAESRVRLMILPTFQTALCHVHANLPRRGGAKLSRSISMRVLACRRSSSPTLDPLVQLRCEHSSHPKLLPSHLC
jgi:hypothetical protein